MTQSSDGLTPQAAPTHDTVQEQLAQTQQALAQLQAEHQTLQAHLDSINNSTIIRATRPLVRAKMRLDRALGRGSVLVSAPIPAPVVEPLPEPTPVQPPRAPAVDIIVPVYRGLADTQRCLQSVLASRYQTPARLIVINDASPDADLTAWLRAFAAQHPAITLLENAQNLGFVATVNRGMAESAEHDVLLLNSDTEVSGDWLDRLRESAYRAPDIGTVTPFSNNATICSYPRFCEANALPDGWTAAQLDALCARLHPGAAIDIPTAVGFCMYIRRDCLVQTGLFDVENFGRGYGEENDFCQRALALGWRSVHALDTFVLHAGGVSFGADKSAREQAAFVTLGRLHPGYAAAVADCVRLDPARPYRNRMDAQRLGRDIRPKVLAVTHDGGGGTLRHVHETAQHLHGPAMFFLLLPLAPGIVRLQSMAPGEGFAQDFHWPAQSDDVIALLRSLGIGHVHYHHFVHLDTTVMGLHQALGVGYDFTAHDYYSACPQISLTTAQQTYCGELGLEQCHACLQERPAPTGEGIEAWRERYRVFLEGARHVLTPSKDAAHRLLRYFPKAPVRCVPHMDLQGVDIPEPHPPYLLPERAHLRVFIVGGLSAIKGGDVVQSCALLASACNAPVEFHLLGIPYIPFHTQPQASLTVHGAYQEHDLQRLLARLQPHVVWFPALWPETYSYTLSACLQAGLPIVATDLGAFPERLAQRPWTWVQAWNTTPEDWLAFFVQLRERHFIPGLAPERPPPEPAALAAMAHSDWSYRRDYCQGLIAAQS